ncbi:MFS transporter [Streptomyces scopuliridis]|uniref:Membrane protein n=1 Tax=Streptomyces scopuliridis RB72 TaxID=1440053 RepID=A0A2T7SVI2_9ACTN|nr:membrane protein [Streptomyces scopuliridis RB72]
MLRDRNAGLYLAGVVVSGFGTSAMWLAAGIWTKSLTGSDSLAALTVFALWAPALAGPLLGTVADRVRRRPLLIGCNLAMAALLPLLLAVDSADRVWILFCVLFVHGASGVLQDAAESALVATAIDPRLLGDFNGLRMTANEGMKLLAPLAGAALFARFGGGSVALLDAATFAVAAGLFAAMRVREEKPGPDPAGRVSDLSEGVRRLRDSSAVRPLVLAASATMLLAGLNGAAIYAVVDRGLGHSPTYVGVLYAVQGAGSVLTGLVAGPLLRRLPERMFAAAGIALFALAVGARALPYDAVVLASAAGVGIGLPCVLIAALTAVQREIPAPVLGRTAATANTLMYVPNALALALGAGLIALAGPAVLLPVTGAAGLLTALALAAPGHTRKRIPRPRPPG